MATTTANYGLTKPEISDIISPTVFANNFQTIDTTMKAIDDSILNRVASACTGFMQAEIISRVGTGTYGASNPTSITFDAAPDIIMLLGTKLDSGFMFGNATYYYAYATVTAVWPTTYTIQYGLGTVQDTYGKKSQDGKTFYMHHYSSAVAQCNSANATYYFLGIKV